MTDWACDVIPDGVRKEPEDVGDADLHMTEALRFHVHLARLLDTVAGHQPHLGDGYPGRTGVRYVDVLSERYCAVCAGLCPGSGKGIETWCSGRGPGVAIRP